MAYTAGTIIMKCNCEHEVQDAMYGKGMRLHNVSKGGKTGENKAFCTVCTPPNSAAFKNKKDIDPNKMLGHGFIKGTGYGIGKPIPQ